MWSFLVLAIVLVGSPFTQAVPEASPVAGDLLVESIETTRSGITVGDWQRIYDPGVEGDPPLAQGAPGEYSWNDHTIVQGPDGTWHAYGITDRIGGGLASSFGHASAPNLTDTPWTGHPYPLTATQADTGPGEPGEEWIWAPHVIEHDGTWYMFYAGPVVDPPAPHERYKIQLATSTDMETWTRYEGNPLFEDGFDGRDPMVMRIGEQWVMYYTATDEPSGGHHVVAWRTSDDLTTWSEREIAFTHPGTGTIAGPTESPFVVEHDGAWYLFVCCGDGVSYLADYTLTSVYRSDDPLHWDYADKVATLPAHAAEVVVDGNGQYHLSSAGYAQQGLHLAPLAFDGETPVKQQIIATDTWRMVVETSPRTLITSMQIAGPNGTFVDILDDDYRGTGPYAAIDPFGDTDAPGAAGTVTWTDDGRTLTLGAIPLGDENATVDWTLTFGNGTMTSVVAWTFGEPRNVLELALYVDTALPAMADPVLSPLPNGDIDDRRAVAAGFPDWALATGNGVTLAMDFVEGSTMLNAGRYAWNPGGAFVWQLVDRGVQIPASTYDGGMWTFGWSDIEDDVALAESLSEAGSGG